MKKKFLQKIIYQQFLRISAFFIAILLNTGVDPTFAVDNYIAQQLKVTGTVTDAKSGEPLPGATVKIKGTTTGVITDFDGKFSVEVANNEAVLVISFVGYAAQEITVGNNTQLAIKLEAETKSLNEVVVLGYGTQSRAKVTGAVSEVSSKELEGRQVRVASQALQGKVAGLVISSTNGQPGSEGLSLSIRGRNSWGTGNSPLVLIDGVPGDMDVLSPEAIESMTVLKDASSAAIYGARAANGVILVTTKRGSSGKIQVTYNSVFSTQKPTMKYESIQDPVEFMKLYNTAQRNTSQNQNYPVLYTDADIAKFQNGTYQGTNWNDYLYQSNLVQEHRLNLTGGTDHVKFNTALSYLDQPGIIRNFGYSRYNFNGNFDLNVNKYISAGGSMSFTRGDMHEPSWGIQNIMVLSVVAKPTYNPTFVDPITGETKTMRARWKKESRNASVKEQLDDLGQHTNMSDILNMQAYLNITPIQGLVWQTKIATYYTHSYDKTWKINDVETWYMDDGNNDKWITGSSYDPKSTRLTINQPWNQTNTIYSTLTYTKTIAEKHNINLMAGYELDYNKYQSMSTYRKGFPSTNLTEMNVGNTDAWTNGGTSSEWAIQSYFGRFNYDFDGKYLIEGVLRNDQSSRFIEGFKAAVFPSVSLGWKVSKEQFMSNFPIISDLKLRTSWGKLGNQDIGNYPYQETYSLGYNYYFDALTTGAASTNLVNKNLSWETTTVKNIGIDLSLKDGFFTLTAEYYNKLTTDILRGAPVMGTVGKSSPTVNNGSMRNTGVELVLGHRNKINDKLSYWVNANMAFNKNKIEDLGGNTEKGGNTINQEGSEYGAYYLYKMIGIYQENDPDLQTLKVDGKTQRPGQIKYQDINGDGNITSDDRQIVGNKYPKCTFGINLGAQYGNFDFSAIIYGVQGYDGYQSYFGFEPFAQGASPQKYWRNAWTPENKSNSWPQIYNTDDAGGSWYRDHPSTFFLQDLSFIRLKNIQLGYNWTSAALKSTPFKSIRVYVSGENLLSHYNNKYAMVDPETAQDNSYSIIRYPQLKTFTFGVTAKF